MRAWAIVAAVALAGCLEPLPAEEAPPTTVLAPEWQVGDWWTYRFTSDVYRMDVTATLVVGEVSDEGYVVGMPLNDYSLDAILFHVPPVGSLGRDLSYNVHDVPFAPFQFPLTDGKRYATSWIASPVDVVVQAENVSVRETTVPGFHFTNAAVKATNERTFEYRYAPSVGWFTMYQRVDTDGSVRERIDLVDHGHDFTGKVRLLDGITIVFLESRTAGALQGTAPTAPVASFTTSPALDTIFVACVFGDAAGHYEIEVRTPTRTACSESGTLEGSDVARRIRNVEVPNEAGQWQARFVAAGQGVSIAEVMGYRAWDVELA